MRSTAHRRTILPALALFAAAGLTRPGPADAEPVSIEGVFGCTLGCADTYEVKCTKASRFLQVRLEALDDADEDSYARFQMTAVGTSPASMDSQDFTRVVENPGQKWKTTAFVRPGSEGQMRAVVTVSPVLNTDSALEYRLTAECAAGVLFGDPPIVSKKTTLIQRLDQ